MLKEELKEEKSGKGGWRDEGAVHVQAWKMLVPRGPSHLIGQ